MIDLDDLVRGANGIDPLPDSALRVARILGADDWQIEEVTGVINLDPTLTARVLRAANSAAYSNAARNVTRVEQAVMRIGSGMLATLVVAPAVRGALRSAGARALSRELWEHSVAASLAADLLRLFASVPIPVEAPTAALLHDLGGIVLALRTSQRDRLQVERAVEMGLTLPRAEREVLGVDHAEVGALVAQRWEFPFTLVEAVRTHHDSGEAAESARVLSDVVAVADASAGAINVDGGEGPVDEAEAALPAARLGLDKSSVGELRDLLKERLAEVLSVYE